MAIAQTKPASSRAQATTIFCCGKPGNVAVVAAARELACFLWAATVAP